MNPMRRRRLLGAAPAVALLASSPARLLAAVEAPDVAARRSAHFPFGPVVPPRPMRAWPVVTQSGTHTDLAFLLRGKATALQLMFTGCSATCPIEGAVFAQLQRDLRPAPGSLPVQLLSLSIDPLSDSPAALAKWLRQFDARPGWTAVASQPADLDAIVELLTAGGEPRPPNARDPHAGQVYLFDPRGSLVYRLASFPSPAAIATAVAAVAQRG